MASIVTADIMCVIFLAVVMQGLIIRKNKMNSSLQLIYCCINSIYACTINALCYLLAGVVPDIVIKILLAIDTGMTALTLVIFLLYCYRFIGESTNVNKWFLIIPSVILFVTGLNSIIYVLSGHMYTVNNGVVTKTTTFPLHVELILLIFLAYFPVFAFSKRKAIGMRSVFTLSIFGAIPFLASMLVEFTENNYYAAGSALSVMLVYTIVQTQHEAEREREYNIELESKNRILEENKYELEEITIQKDARLQEITALNEELADKQDRIQHYVDEQQEYISKITELNDKLNDNIRIISNAGYGVWRISISDAGVRMMEINNKLAQILGIDKKPYTPEKVYDVFHSRLLDSVDEIEKDYQLMYEGKVRNRIIKWAHPDKGTIYLMIGGTNHQLANGKMTISGSCGDVTEQKLAEEDLKESLRKAKLQAEQASKAKTDFLFNMSHDIRTPMNAILGYTKLMRLNPDDKEKTADYIRKIERSSGFLLSLINNVLDMARIESGKLTIDEEVVNTVEFHKSLCSVFKEQLDQKGITFVTALEIEHENVFADKLKLQQVFLNILSNAMKYTNQGGTITLICRELEQTQEGYANLEMIVSDTGIGMSKEYLPHLFDEFIREQTYTDSKIEGTGLGMPIVKRLVDFMGGTIEVESELGKGTTFTIKTSHRIATEAKSDKRVAKLLSKVNLAGKRILLTEDHEMNAEIATEILKSFGIESEWAKDGIECIDKLQHAEDDYYDLILMDIQMPNMDGYKATKNIRSMLNEKKKNIPIIAMTANAFESDRQNALDAGMNGHIAKPFDVPELLATLAENLKE